MGASAQSLRTAAGLHPTPVPAASHPVLAPGATASLHEDAVEAKIPHQPSPSPTQLLLCNASQDELKEEGLKFSDLCPVCHIAVARHRCLPPAPATVVASPSTSTSRSSTELGKNVHLPRWKHPDDGYFHAKPFLDRIEHLFVADNVDESAWPRLLLKAIPNVTESAWVKLNIVDKKVNWTTARTLFNDHFEVQTWTEQSQQLYEQCRQGVRQSVQDYADRFMSYVTELGYQDDNQLVIQHFQLGLIPSIQAKIRDRVLLLRDMQNQLSDLSLLSLSISQSTPYTIRSLKKMIELAVNIERSAQVSSAIQSGSASGVATSSSSSSTNGGSASSSSKSDASTPDKSCIYHPGKSHSTAECRNPHSQISGKSATSAPASTSTVTTPASGTRAQPGSTVLLSKQGKPVVCYSCKGNHYANDKACPQRSDRATRSGASGSGSPPSSAPARSQPTPPGGNSPSTPAPIQGHAVRLTALSGSASLLSVSRPLSATAVLPTKLTVYFMVAGRVYSTLVDSGAEISFADLPLVTSWSAITVTPPTPGAKISLAHADMFTDRLGSVELDVTALFPCSDREATSFRCRFEMMPIHGVGNEHHFIVGRDLIPVLFPAGIPLAYLPQQTSSCVTVAASSTLVDSLSVSSSDSMLGSMPVDDVPEKFHLSTPEQMESEYALPRQLLHQALAPLLAVNSAITGFCSVPEAVVRLEVDPADAPRLWRRQYAIAQSLHDAATVIIDRWFREGKVVLAPPGCPYNNPITVAPKKDENGKLTGARPCLDVRALNQVLKSNDRFLIPHIRTLLDSFAGNSIFSEFDLQRRTCSFHWTLSRSRSLPSPGTVGNLCSPVVHMAYRCSRRSFSAS